LAKSVNIQLKVLMDTPSKEKIYQLIIDGSNSTSARVKGLFLQECELKRTCNIRNYQVRPPI
jgi:hypothetical protein